MTITAGSVRAAAIALASLVAHASGAQSAPERSPNLANTWAPRRGVVQANFTHRFDISEEPLRKLTNTPTFHVATGITSSLGVGFSYGSNSDLVPAYPNEWEWFTRWSPLIEGGGAPLDVSLQAGWNQAAESADAELSAARHVGPLRLLIAGRAFHHAFYRDTARYAIAAGATLRFSPWLSVAGDYASLVGRRADERPVWGAGVQLSVPYTPHSMSIHASNAGTGTLEGASRGSHTRWGFEYTVPITLGRYGARTPRVVHAGGDTPPTSGAMTMSPMSAPDTVVVMIRDFKFQMVGIRVKVGDVVVWRNADQVEHTITADSGEFKSTAIKPGGAWSFRFVTPGKSTYYCTPHPFMKAEIHVYEVKS